MQYSSSVAHYIRAPTGYYRAEGTIRNVNTIEEYRSMDKAQMLEQAGKMVSSIGQKLACSMKDANQSTDLGCYK